MGAGQGGVYRDIVDPATEGVLTQAADASVADVQRAIAAARRALTRRPVAPDRHA
ncbi:hypothetical protein ACU4HD_47285 [Cupriavidus basilensis]